LYNPPVFKEKIVRGVVAMTEIERALGAHFLQNALARFRSDEALGRRAIEQITDETQLGHTLDPESNSIATIVCHMAGNMRSRWTDFLTTDGEKPDRDRDSEFEAAPAPSREELLRLWEEGWRHVYATVSTLEPEDLIRTVTIRGEPHTVLEAITRQLTHYAYHVGQIVFLAKHVQSTRWQSLSIPRRRRGAGER
jgi:hypothetical protein